MRACFAGDQGSTVGSVEIRTEWPDHFVLFNGIIDARRAWGWAAEAAQIYLQ